MSRLPFAKEFAVLASNAANSEDLLNFYAETVPEGSRGTEQAQGEAGKAKSRFVLKSTPGLDPDFILGAGPIVEMDGTLPGTIYAVSGTHAYRLAFTTGTSTPVITDLGSIGSLPDGSSTTTPAKLVTISVGLLAAVILNPPNAYWCGHQAGSLTQITDPNFPGADSVAYLDGVFYFAYGTQVFGTALLDASTLPPLNFTFADAVPNIGIQKLITYNGDVWFVGDAGCEVFYDSGAANFPLAPRPGAVLTQGAANGATVRICDGRLYWLGADGSVYRSNGYRAERVSSFALEDWIKAHTDVVHVDALSYVLAGHWCYMLNFYTDGATKAASFAFDTREGLWHRRASTADGAGAYRGRCSAQFGADVLIGDRQGGGQVFTLNPAGTQDAGTTVLRRAVLPPIYADGKRAFMTRLELECEIAAGQNNPAILLDYSDNGSQGYGTARAASVAVVAGRRGALPWSRLGSFRQRTLRFSILGRTTLYGADADVTPGSW